MNDHHYNDLWYLLKSLSLSGFLQDPLLQSLHSKACVAPKEVELGEVMKVALADCLDYSN